MEQGARLGGGRLGRTPLDLAVGHGHFPVVKYLVERLKVEINPGGFSQSNALHIAAARGNLPLITYLVDHGGDISAKDGNGKTPVDVASAWGHDEVVEYFLALVSDGGVPGGNV